MSAAANKQTGMAGRLALSAAPTFALMALVSGLAAPPPSLCMAGATLLPIDGMTAMYLLMSLFHLPVWLKLAGRN